MAAFVGLVPWTRLCCFVHSVNKQTAVRDSVNGQGDWVAALRTVGWTCGRRGPRWGIGGSAETARRFGVRRHGAVVTECWIDQGIKQVQKNVDDVICEDRYEYLR